MNTQNLQPGDPIIVTQENLDTMLNEPVSDAGVTLRPNDHYLDKMREVVAHGTKGEVNNAYPQYNMLVARFGSEYYSMRMTWVTCAL